MLLLVLVALCAGVLVTWRRTMASRTRVDTRASSMATARDQRELEEAAMRAQAQSLGAACTMCGLPMGRSVRTGRPLFCSLEWVQLWIMGPRAGKTSCMCVPQILEADGPVVATSNKRDDSQRPATESQLRKGTHFLLSLRALLLTLTLTFALAFPSRVCG